jgi:apolipoprotein N-acyltransferase
VPRIEALYDKAHLVPFGEYAPGKGLLTRLGFRVPNIVSDGFAPGEGSVVLDTLAAPRFAPMICYEAIFPRFIPRGEPRPAFMLNVSNDSWFGASMGPKQHFAQARYRAIEEGLPLIRAASGGTSGAVDAWGRVRGALAPGRPDVLDLSAPAPAEPTFYSRYGELASLLLLLVCALVAVGGRALLPGVGLTKPPN